MDVGWCRRCEDNQPAWSSRRFTPPVEVEAASRALRRPLHPSELAARSSAAPAACCSPQPMASSPPLCGCSVRRTTSVSQATIGYSNRARGSARHAAGTLLRLLVKAFVPAGPVLIGLDATVERRRGAKLSGRSMDRDAVRSSGGCFQKTSGLRRLGPPLIAPVRWAKRPWALPLLSALAPSGNNPPGVRAAGRRPKPKPLGERAATSARTERAASRSKASVCPRPKSTWQSRALVNGHGGAQRWVETADATPGWWRAGKPPVNSRRALVRAPQAPRSTFVGAAPPGREPAGRSERGATSCAAGPWRRPCQETRVSFGVEGQGQWNDQASASATPLRLARFSLVTLTVAQQTGWQGSVRPAAWHQRTRPTFSDALAQVRRGLWCQVRPDEFNAVAWTHRASPPTHRSPRSPSLTSQDSLLMLPENG